MNEVYNSILLQLVRGQIDLVSAPLKVLLVNNSFVFNPQHTTVSQIVTSEFSGTNYQRKTVTGKSASIDNFTNTATLYADNPSWSLVIGDVVKAAVVYKQVNNDSDSQLISVTYINPAFTTNGGIFTIKGWHDTGVLKLFVS